MYEQEADRVAAQMIGSPQFAHLPHKCVCEGTPGPDGECSACRATPLGLQPHAVTENALLEVPPIVREVLQSPGRPLDTETRTFMDARLGHDFGHVRVHADGAAAASAEAVNALAYTMGSDIVFRAGQYMPHSNEGRHLLAHELAHVVQQRQSGAPAIQRQPTPGGLAELERHLKDKQQERAALQKDLDESSQRFARGIETRDAEKTRQAELARMKTGALSDLQRVLKDPELSELKKTIDIVRTDADITLRVRFELSYLALKEAEGKKAAAADIPRIENVLRDAWSADMTKGLYQGAKFRLEPDIQFRPNSRARNDKSLQIIVQKDAEYSIGDYLQREIRLSKGHLEGDRVIVVAHELYHLFGFIVDRYYIPGKGSKQPYVVGRSDVGGRPDLLGMVDPKHLRAWLREGKITKAEFDRQMAKQPRVWEEDVDIILRALSVAAPASKAKPPMTDPESEAFDPVAALKAQEEALKRKEAEIAGKTKRAEEAGDWVRKAERAMQLDQEIAALQKRIADLKAGAQPRRP
jgi:hypothetical protein